MGHRGTSIAVAPPQGRMGSPGRGPRAAIARGTLAPGRLVAPVRGTGQRHPPHSSGVESFETVGPLAESSPRPARWVSDNLL